MKRVLNLSVLVGLLSLTACNSSDDSLWARVDYIIEQQNVAANPEFIPYFGVISFGIQISTPRVTNINGLDLLYFGDVYGNKTTYQTNGLSSFTPSELNGNYYVTVNGLNDANDEYQEQIGINITNDAIMGYFEVDSLVYRDGVIKTGWQECTNADGYGLRISLATEINQTDVYYKGSDLLSFVDGATKMETAIQSVFVQYPTLNKIKVSVVAINTANVWVTGMTKTYIKGETMFEEDKQVPIIPEE
ncbi:MAG: hypothetical protein LBM07_08255 [Culturomica sp.]|jgi:hypothetical protein|nr:hypothetical protein [Culturomica sp.]